MRIANPLNPVQVEFNELCAKGGGAGGGPARGKVQELLHNGSKTLNTMAFDEISQHLKTFSSANPWHVCFAVGLGWGHLAQIDEDFTAAAIEVLTNLDPAALSVARKFHLERGPTPIEQSLRGGYLMFDRVKLPNELPDDLSAIGQAQQRWFKPLIPPSVERPKYIGSWNATAMFMVALFSKPHLASKLIAPEVLLPPGGPIFNGLDILWKAKIFKRPPPSNELDDDALKLGSIYESNALMAELLQGRPGWSMIDVHSGLYMLGTRYPASKGWV